MFGLFIVIFLIIVAYGLYAFGDEISGNIASNTGGSSEGGGCGFLLFLVVACFLAIILAAIIGAIFGVKS